MNTRGRLGFRYIRGSMDSFCKRERMGWAYRAVGLARDRTVKVLVDLFLDPKSYAPGSLVALGLGAILEQSVEPELVISYCLAQTK